MKLPTGQETDNEALYEREWTKAAKIVGRELGLNLRSVHGYITFEEVYLRANKRTAVSQVFHIDHDVVMRMYCTISDLKEQIKELKEEMDSFEFVDETEESDDAKKPAETAG